MDGIEVADFLISGNRGHTVFISGDLFHTIRVLAVDPDFHSGQGLPSIAGKREDESGVVGKFPCEADIRELDDRLRVSAAVGISLLVRGAYHIDEKGGVFQAFGKEFAP